MIRKLLDVLRAVDTRPLLALACVTQGLLILRAIAQERQAHLDQLDAAISDRTAELRDLHAALDAQCDAYPAQVDVDPLHRAAETAPA